MVDSRSGILTGLCERGVFLGASDLHVIGDCESRFRIQGQLSDAGAIVPTSEVEALLEKGTNEVQRKRFHDVGMTDFALAHDLFGRMRVSLSKAHQGYMLAMRFLPAEPIPFENLHMPEVIKEFAQKPNGLVLFSGQTGSGKTTLQASLIDHINKTQSRRIITFEDPIEFEFTSAKSMITQFEVGQHIASFADGIRGAMRADPEVIVLGEMRDTVTVEAAVSAAESGHLVFGTIHASSPASFAERMLGFFPADRQSLVKIQLSQCLVGVVGMNLVRKKDGKSRRAAVEILAGNDAVKNIIANGDTRSLRNAMVSGRKEGMQTLETHLNELIRGGVISYEEAASISHFPSEITARTAAA